MRRPDRRWLKALGFTLTVVVLINLSVTESFGLLNLVLLAGLFAAAAFFFLVFPGSQFFNVALVNFLAVYVCLFVLFTEVNFAPQVADWAVMLGFLLPIAAFLAGALWRREQIRSIVTASHVREEHHFGRVFWWLLPIAVIGALTFLLPGSGLGRAETNAAFLAAMMAIAGIVLFVSPSISTFLLDTGLLFEDFFKQTARLIRPAFAFLTFYSMQVILFGALYRVIDRFSNVHHFTIDGVAREITFLESLYFSLISVSTVGYGDINPASHLVRLVVGGQIVVGVLLLLFGVSEILRYSRERHGHD